MSCHKIGLIIPIMIPQHHDSAKARLKNMCRLKVMVGGGFVVRHPVFMMW